MQRRPIMIMAGGTGGHVYPALAVADFFRSRDIPLYWLGTRNGLEASVVPDNGIELLTLAVSGVRGKGLASLVAAPFRVLFSICQALKIFLRLQPSAVLGMGGFVSGPGGVAAWLLRIPLYIHEQNRIAGLTNKLLAPLARLVFEAFPHTFTGRRARVVTCGNPVRRSITAIPPPDIRMDAGREQVRILVLGGSQGAQRLNQVVPEALARLHQVLPVQVRHQCGRRNLDSARHAYRDMPPGSAQVHGFIDDMAAAYQWADLAITRAGALTIAELCNAGVAAVLVPFPHAVDDHQTMNARFMSEANAAILIPESRLTVAALFESLQDLCSDRQKLLSMAVSGRKLASPDAAAVVGRYCLGETHA